MTTTARVAAMAEGRRAAIARTAGVDRTILYRHRDLLGQVHAMASKPAADPNSTAPSRASLQADLLATQQRLITARASTPGAIESEGCGSMTEQYPTPDALDFGQVMRPTIRTITDIPLPDLSALVRLGYSIVVSCANRRSST